jgi:hypothetical protein
VTSAPSTSRPVQAESTDGRGGALRARIKRNAWLLGAFAILFYVGYLAYYFWRSAAGG